MPLFIMDTSGEPCYTEELSDEEKVSHARNLFAMRGGCQLTLEALGWCAQAYRDTGNQDATDPSWLTSEMKEQRRLTFDLSAALVDAIADVIKRFPEAAGAQHEGAIGNLITALLISARTDVGMKYLGISIVDGLESAKRQRPYVQAALAADNISDLIRRHSQGESFNPN